MAREPPSDVGWPLPVRVGATRSYGVRAAPAYSLGNLYYPLVIVLSVISALWQGNLGHW
ncbi:MULTISPECIES: hypothetical protein [unclassified Rhodococcus (in: high G+C Gram-positive bacteria)]|uniref:hypothetical protein n=1 Tax=unclassified Rhodococcus (in: high G+C Gram-positive bacteria) TaxID=192944 RepID=UPI00163A673A|nr:MULTISPECIES: hypothetical protein [unclassified Rhodococcus (in: high G+C Gram-positive bacteria)]MBC2644481.1 hypothetical protein [Rhodococcus sp. 3A]MBC2897831.1 hypothetical protein [Rhodococcus sp. 4CII]